MNYLDVLNIDAYFLVYLFFFFQICDICGFGLFFDLRGLHRELIWRFRCLSFSFFLFVISVDHLNLILELNWTLESSFVCRGFFCFWNLFSGDFQNYLVPSNFLQLIATVTKFWCVSADVAFVESSSFLETLWPLWVFITSLSNFFGRPVFFFVVCSFWKWDSKLIKLKANKSLMSPVNSVFGEMNPKFTVTLTYIVCQTPVILQIEDALLRGDKHF